MYKNLICFFTIAISSLIGTNSLLADSSVSKELCYAIQPPSFCAATEVTALSSKEIVEKVTPILRERLTAINYDRIFPMSQFLDHFQTLKEKDAETTPLDALKTFCFNPRSTENRGGPCLTLTLDIYDALPDDIHSYMVLAKLPVKYQQFAFPEYSHSAILIKYFDPSCEEDAGYIILDPSFDFNEPIVVKKDGTPFYYNTRTKGLWRFSVQGDDILCEIIKENVVVDFMIYRTTKVLNPIESSAIPMFIVDRKFSLLSRDPMGTQLAHLNIEMNKNRVIWNEGSVRFDPIAFFDLQAGKLIPSWFTEKLCLTDLQLAAKLNKVIEHKDVVNDLYRAYLSLIRETLDFSITGTLDIDKLDDILNN